jgi:hypothetical protein
MAVIAYTGKARSLTVAWGTGDPKPAVRAKLPVVPMDTTERASVAGKASAAAKTPTERREAAAAAARVSHGPVARFRRAIKVWGEATDDERREIRRELRDAGIIR